ncbi:MAG: GNAT family N-acetyltransferase [Promethearchaeota archaeon]
MQPYFRALNNSDIPAIIKFTSQIWEGRDYIPEVIDKWIVDPQSLNIGIFSEPTLSSENLIGMGRVKYFTPTHVWFEGWRIHNDYQKMGIGSALTTYAVTKMREKGVKLIHWETWSTRTRPNDKKANQNKGSLGLARNFNFQKKGYLDMLIRPVDGYNSQNFILANHLKQISAEEAYNKYITIPNKPKVMLNQGWTFIPLELSFLKEIESDTAWFASENAVIQIYNTQDRVLNKGPDLSHLWLIVYGNPDEAQNLVNSVIKKKLVELPSLYREIAVFCPIEISSKIQELGFSFLKGEPSGEVLFEMKL